MKRATIIKSIIFAAVALAAGGCAGGLSFHMHAIRHRLKAETPTLAIVKSFEKGQ